jgi:hypothetical protein
MTESGPPPEPLQGLVKAEKCRWKDIVDLEDKALALGRLNREAL